MSKTKTASDLPSADSLVSLIGLTANGTMARMKPLVAVFPPDKDLNMVTAPGFYRYTSGVLHRPQTYGVAVVIMAETHLMMYGFSQTPVQNMLAFRYFNNSTKSWTKWVNIDGAEMKEINS